MSPEVKCTHCGMLNLDTQTKCRMCGHPLHLTEGEVRKCPQCSSTATPLGTDRCIACGWDFGTHQPLPTKEEPSAERGECEPAAEAPLHTVRTFGVDLAVIFMILAGGLGIIHAILASLPDTSREILSSYESVIPMGEFLDGVLQDHVAVSVLMFVFGVLAIVLSMTALRRSSFPGALAGAVFGILSIGFLFGAFFGLMALILLVISKREFLLECA
jgi:hypothetical protein